MTDQPTCSFIIPAYNEGARLRETLAEVTKTLRKRPFSSEVIVVDDGSTDATPEIVAEFSQVRSVRNDTNQGKGFSVRRGMLAAAGAFLVFSDADLSVPLIDLDRILNALRDWPLRTEPGGADVAIATRRGPGARIARRQPLPRHLAGMAYGWVVQRVLHTGTADCQCGFKGFTREAAEQLFSRQTVTGFCFDTELIVIARTLDLTIAEIPVVWWHRDGTALSMRRHLWPILREVRQIRRNLAAGTYADGEGNPGAGPGV